MLTNRSSSGLEESKQEVNRNDEEISESNTETKEVVPKRNIDQEETNSTSKQSNSQNSRRVESVTQLSRDDVSGSVRSHEDGVHLGKDEWVVSSLSFELLLDGGVTFTGEVGHEVPSEGDEEGPPVGGQRVGDKCCCC
jgi:hypothetical protein